MGSSARVLVAGDTNVGMKRTHNEDAFEVIDEERLYIVADGMGGHASGEVASKMAIDTMREFFKATSADPEATWPYKMDKSRGYEENRLITSIKLSNLRIYEAAQRDPKLRGMGTTLVGILVVDDGVLIAHVGDSRCYRLRDDKLEQLTEDHSLLNDYIKMKRLSEEEIANFPHKNVIVRALGLTEQVQVDTQARSYESGDRFLLCSDGLTDLVGDDSIAEAIATAGEPEEACQELVTLALRQGGIDNITVLCVFVEDDTEEQA